MDQVVPHEVLQIARPANIINALIQTRVSLISHVDNLVAEFTTYFVVFVADSHRQLVAFQAR